MTQDWVTSTLMTMTVLMLEQYGPVTRSFHTFTILDFTIIPCVAGACVCRHGYQFIEKGKVKITIKNISKKQLKLLEKT